MTYPQRLFWSASSIIVMSLCWSVYLAWLFAAFLHSIGAI